MPEPPPLGTPAPTTSLAGRLLDIFAAPGEVFEEVKASPPSVANWLVPVFISAIIGVLSAIIIFSQPAIIQQMREQQTKLWEDRVSAGKMTRAQADQVEAASEKFSSPTLLMISGSFGAVFSSFVRVFWWAVVLWLLGLVFLKTKFDYLKTAEVAGLATMITVLGSIVSLLLTVILGKMSTPSLALFVDQFDPKNAVHVALAAVNLFALWQIGVMAAGLARLSGARFSKALTLTSGYWVAVQLFFILLAVLINAIFTMAK